MPITTVEMTSAMPLIVACINMAVTMMHMYMTTTEAIRTQRAHKKRSRRRIDCESIATHTCIVGEHESDEDTLEHPHRTQIFDLLAWHVHSLDAKWYVKP
jgi:hypothetical protein